MAYFPMFIDIEKKKCLVAGGGTVALRKVRVLLDFGAQITVVAPQIDPQILQLTGNVCVKERTFEPEDLKECVLVVAATDDVTENHRIARMAQKKHIPVNAVDQQEDCSFIFPSYLKHRDLVGAFSSAGNSPVLTQYLKESLKEILTEELGQINDYMGSIRPVVKTRIETDKMFRKENCKARVAYLNGSKAIEAPPVELIQFVDSEIHKVKSDLFTTSISEVCFYTDDIDSVYKTLVENHVECLSEPQYFDFRADGFGESRAFYFRDPDGIILEMMQPL